MNYNCDKKINLMYCNINIAGNISKLQTVYTPKQQKVENYLIRLLCYGISR